MTELGSDAPTWGEFARGKFWFERRGSKITLGLTDSAIQDIGEVENIDLPAEGEDFGKGEVVATVEGSRGSVEITAPVDGVVASVNENITAEPDTLSEDPLEEGWLVKFEVEDPEELEEEAEAEA